MSHTYVLNKAVLYYKAVCMYMYACVCVWHKA